MEKKPFVTLAQAEEIAKTYPTPFICMMKRYPRKCKTSETGIFLE